MNALDPKSTAVLVVDVQVGVFDTHPAPLDKDEVLERINAVTRAGRLARGPIIFLQHDGDADGQWLRPFTDDWKLHPSLEVGRDDRVVRKTACDGFYRTELEGCFISE